jgi:uncharacterized membrane protein HdeD (DUF308 family)
MSELLKKIKTNSLVTALLYTALGVILLAKPDLSISLLCMVLGAILLICGVVDVILFLAHRDGSLYSGFHLVAGVILGALGIWIMTQPVLIVSIIPRIIGILICIHGVCDIADAVTLQRGKFQRWGTALILALLTLLLGVILVVRPFGVLTTAVRIIGAFLLFDGLSDVWIAVCVGKVQRQAKKDEAAQQSAVDVDYTDVQDEKKP